MVRLNTQIADHIKIMLDSFSEEMDITQKSIVNIALKEFFAKFGQLEKENQKLSLQ